MRSQIRAAVARACSRSLPSSSAPRRRTRRRQIGRSSRASGARTPRPWSPRRDPADRRRPGRARPVGCSPASAPRTRPGGRARRLERPSRRPRRRRGEPSRRRACRRAPPRRRRDRADGTPAPPGRRSSTLRSRAGRSGPPAGHLPRAAHTPSRATTTSWVRRPAARVDRHRGRRSRRRVRRRSPARRSSCSLLFLPIGSAPLLLLTPDPPETHRHRLRAAYACGSPNGRVPARSGTRGMSSVSTTSIISAGDLGGQQLARDLRQHQLPASKADVPGSGPSRLTRDRTGAGIRVSRAVSTAPLQGGDGGRVCWGTGEGRGARRRSGRRRCPSGRGPGPAAYGAAWRTQSVRSSPAWGQGAGRRW